MAMYCQEDKKYCYGKGKRQKNKNKTAKTPTIREFSDLLTQNFQKETRNSEVWGQMVNGALKQKSKTNNLIVFVFTKVMLSLKHNKAFAAERKKRAPAEKQHSTPHKP